MDVLDPDKQYQHRRDQHQQRMKVLVKSSGDNLVGAYVGEKENRGGDDQSPVLPEKEFVVFEGRSFADVAVDAVVAKAAPVSMFSVVDGYKDQVGECKDDHPYP